MLTKTILAIAAVVLLAGSALATNGYFSHGFDVQTKGMAGAGVALPQSALCASVNPAGMVRVGKSIDLSISLFSPKREYTVTGMPSGFDGTFGLMPQTVESESNYFVIPAFGFNSMINETSSFGLAVYGNGGMNTTYPVAVFHGYDTTGVNLSQIFFTPTYSKMINKNHSFGISAIVAYQWFKATGLEAFSTMSSDAENLTGNGHDYSLGFGARLGYLGELTDGLSFGASYQTKVLMSKFEKYAGLFAEQGNFDIPSNVTAGFAWKATKALTVAADVQHIFYGDSKAVSNPMNPAQFQEGILLGDDEGSGFGWEDMTIIKFGLEYEVLPDIILRGGFSTGSQPIPEEEVMFNILAPGVIEQHITFGFTRKLCKGKELSVAIMHALSSDIEGANPLEAPGQQTIGLKMNQWEFTVGLGF